jgi:hypothetical protein
MGGARAPVFSRPTQVTYRRSVAAFVALLAVVAQQVEDTAAQREPRHALVSVHAAQRAHRGMSAALVRRKRVNMGDQQRKGTPAHAEARPALSRNEPLRRFRRQRSPPLPTQSPPLPLPPPLSPQSPTASPADTQSQAEEELAETTATVAEEVCGRPALCSCCTLVADAQAMCELSSGGSTAHRLAGCAHGRGRRR